MHGQRVRRDTDVAPRHGVYTFFDPWPYEDPSPYAGNSGTSSYVLGASVNMAQRLLCRSNHTVRPPTMSPMQSPRKTLELRPSVPRDPKPLTRESGFFPSVDEFAGLERLDREELDEDEA